MSDLGRQLKEARMARGLTLDDVQEMTKIRKRYLEAIEAGDYKVLPGSFYVRAFIKTYAEAVGVSPDDLMTEHQDDMPVSEPEPTMEPVLQRSRTKSSVERNAKWLPTTLMWSFAVIIVVVIYLVVTLGNKGDGNKAVDPTPVTNTSDKNTSNVGQSDQNKGGTTNQGDQQAVPGGTTGNPDDKTATDPNGTTDPAQGNGTTTDPAQTPVTSGVVITDNGRKGSSEVFNVESPNSAPVKVVITATGRSWVEVRRGDRNGEKLYYKTTEADEVLSYDLDSQGLYIKSGSSSHTTITVGGQTVQDGRSKSKIQLNLVAPGTSTNPGTTDNSQQNTTDNSGADTNTGTETDTDTDGN